MGNSTGSTMYMFGAVIVIYIAGMLLYQGFQWLKKKREQKNRQRLRSNDQQCRSKIQRPKTTIHRYMHGTKKDIVCQNTHNDEDKTVWK